MKHLIAAAIAACAVVACDRSETTRLREENAALTNDVHRLAHDGAELRARLQRAHDAIDDAQDSLDAAQAELERLPDLAAAADSVAAKLDEAADALDDAADATDATDGPEATAPMTVRADSPKACCGAGAGEGNRKLTGMLRVYDGFEIYIDELPRKLPADSKAHTAAWEADYR